MIFLEKLLIIILIICSFQTEICGQREIIRYFTPNLQVNKNPICSGEIAIITIQCGFENTGGSCSGLGLYNITYFVNNLGDLDCKRSLPVLTTTGNNIISSQIEGDIVLDCSNAPSLQIKIKVNPKQSSNYNISWSVKFEYPPLPQFGGVTSETLVYDGGISIAVIEIPPKPTIKASKGLILSTETSTLTANGCNNLSTYQWKEDCQNSNWNSLGNPITVGAGTYRARCVQNGCVGEPSEPINIILDTPPPSALGCSNSDAESIYNFTRNGDDGRSDYHQYNVVTTICKKSPSDTKCTVDEVWEKLKSSAWNNAPLAGDLVPKVGNKLPVIFSNVLFDSPELPVINCGKVNLPSNFGILFSLGILSNGIGSTVFGSLVQGIFCNRLQLTQEANPIVQTIDESSHSITNYTQCGHILHPGRVVRNVVEECGEIKIKTVGVGRSWLGNNLGGQIAGGMNSLLGPLLFENIDERVKNSF